MEPTLSTEEAAAKRLQGPGVTVTDDLIDSKIADVKYYNPEGTLIIAVLTMLNGFTVVGHAACADPLKFDLEVGKRYAYNNARSQLWPLEGYLLKQSLWENNGARLTQPETANTTADPQPVEPAQAPGKNVASEAADASQSEAA